MTPERWKRVEELYHAAGALPPDERPGFLAEACGEDEAMRRDVESLLNEPASDDGLLDEPALVRADQLVSEVTPASMSGRSFNGYHLETLLGAGGMGEVYRARDSKLGRDVAIKFLPPAFTSDPDRLARFEREARMLAALNHPNICAIYGIEEADGIRFLVLELVEGTTLAETLASVSSVRSPDSGLPPRDALMIARQISDALEIAHEKGIIHRDLKPANIKITPHGVVKVLDFGLAKAVVHVDGSAPDLTQAPAAGGGGTREGAVVGTAAYMSPEQACGKVVDRRTDIWAFGVVVFEMLTGHSPFFGETTSETIASVLKTDPDWDVLPAAVPPPLRRLLARCLEKDPKRRLQAIGEARVQIEDLLSGAVDGSLASVDPRPLRLRGRALPWVAAGALGFALAVVLWAWAPWRPVSPLAPLRVSAELGADASFASTAVGAAAIISPDGAIVAFVGHKSETDNRQLYVRRLHQLQAAPLAGTDGADSPFFSPDGRWIGFFAGDKLKKISVTGGLPLDVCDVLNGRGGAWAEDGTIVFSPGKGRGVRLHRVSSAGGKDEPLTSLAEGEVTQRWPQVLPGGTAVLYTSSTSPGDFGEANLVVQPLTGGARKVVWRGGYYGRYLPSGHLVYIHDGKLVAAPFDLGRLEVTGPGVSALEGVASNADTGGAHFAVSASGTLVYLPGQSVPSGALIHWMDRAGKTTALRSSLENWSNLLFAPDGRRLAMQIAAPGRGPSDVWVEEWERGRRTQLTSDPAFDSKPVWSPDSRYIAFGSARGDQSTLNLYVQPASGPGGARRLTDSRNQQRPASWHRDGTFLAFEEQNSATSWDVMILSMEGDVAPAIGPGKPTVFLNSPSAEREPMFSPDGRWLAYHSNESQRDEVYVRPFPGPGDKVMISTAGGTYPTWSRTRPELFYGNNGQIMVAAFSVAGESFLAEKPRSWSNGRYLERPGNRGFDLHPDGERFALASVGPMPTGTKQDKFILVANFFDELRRLVPATKR